MKVSLALLGPFVLSAAAAAFTPPVFAPKRVATGLHSTATDEDTSSPPPLADGFASAKTKLLDTAKSLKDEYGPFLILKSAKDELKAAVEELENSSEAPLVSDETKELFLGDWTLLCTTVTNNDGVDTSKFPSFLQQGPPDPLKKIRDSIREAANKFIVVQQRVRSTNDDGVINRIDHSLEYQPPEQLKQLFENLPEQLANVNINPLHVSKNKLVLVHDATIDEEDISAFKTKISLQSVVLNVAGTSTVLDPDGKDVAGFNIPTLGDFMNTNTFETTYMDDTLRVSRGKLGRAEAVRVFVRTSTLAVDEEEEVDDDSEAEAVTAELVDEEDEEYGA